MNLLKIQCGKTYVEPLLNTACTCINIVTCWICAAVIQQLSPTCNFFSLDVYLRTRSIIIVLTLDIDLHRRAGHITWFVMCFTRIFTTITFHNFRNKKFAHFIIYSCINLCSWDIFIIFFQFIPTVALLMLQVNLSSSPTVSLG